MNNYGINDYTKFQAHPEQVKQSLAYITSKAAEVKRMIEELLYLIDLQENAPWPDMLEKYAAIMATMTQLQGAFRKAGIPMTHEDNGHVLRSNVIVPQLLTLDPNPELQRLTEGRVHSWNHEVVPDYLRTKPLPEVEQEEIMLEQERQSKATDHISKQIAAMNKHADSLIQQLANLERSSADASEFKPTYVCDDTVRLVRAIMIGEGLRIAPKPQPQIPVQQQIPGAPMTSMPQAIPQQPMPGQPMRR